MMINRRIRHLPAGLAAVVLLLGAATAEAVDLASLSTKDAAAGLKAALSQGVDRAVGQLGATDGFLKNPRVTIPLPGVLEKADSTLRMLGMGGDADALREAMNHAAESAVHESAPVFKKSLQKMSLTDAKGILTGGETSATEYFKRTASDELKARFKPIVQRATAKAKLAGLYNQVAGKAASLGLVGDGDANVDDYVTNRALDGLWLMIADEEKAIRKDPVGQASSLIRKVFGAQ